VLEAHRASAPLRGRLTPPGDKSVSHRALIFSALAQGRSTIQGLLDSADVRATQSALEQLGAVFTRQGTSLLIDGLGADGLSRPATDLDMGNSGTAMRLLAGVLAAQDFDSRLTGDASLSSRPMRRIMRPLQMMGADIRGREGDTAPLEIRGRPLAGIDYQTPVASAQIKSCVLLAGLFASGRTRVTEPSVSRDHTERMLRQFGVAMNSENAVYGGTVLKAASVSVPADISSAAFPMAAALLVEGSDIRLHRVGLNPTRDGFIRVLKAMGADLSVTPLEEGEYEPVADIRVRYSGRLKAVDLPAEWVPSMVDEIPVLMALAARANGITRIRGAAELRVKESDRLAVMGEGLRKLGIELTDYQGGVDVTGSDRLVDQVLESAGDHRCAMSFAVLGLSAQAGFRIRDAAYIATSYPGFVEDMNSLGANMRMRDSND
jgi:3-phosphoshikimate 1-carboxyvinyltransferase